MFGGSQPVPARAFAASAARLPTRRFEPDQLHVCCDCGWLSICEFSYILSVYCIVLLQVRVIRVLRDSAALVLHRGFVRCEQLHQNRR